VREGTASVSRPLSDDDLRSILASQSSPTALAFERRYWLTVTLASAALLVQSVVRQGIAEVPWTVPAVFGLATVRLVLARRRGSRGALLVTEAELERARRQLRPCPRCGQLVHPLERRCPGCGKVWHQYLPSGGRDAWMPLAMILTFLLIIVWASLWVR
jgi:hypothetical protein